MRAQRQRLDTDQGSDLVEESRTHLAPAALRSDLADRADQLALESGPAP